MPDHEALELEAFVAERIPGATMIDVQRHLSAPHSETVKFNFTRETDSEMLACRLGALGIPSAHAEIVLYSRQVPGSGDLRARKVSGLFGATRAWWTLTSWGFTNVYVLDGGFEAWKAEQRETSSGPTSPSECSFDFSSLVDLGHLKASQSDVLEAIQEGSGVQLLDTLPGWPNTAVNYGREPARQGHIPTALNIPAKSLLTEDGHFKDLASLRELFEGQGVDVSKPLIAY